MAWLSSAGKTLFGQTSIKAGQIGTRMGRCPISSQQHAKTSRLGDKTAQVWSKNRASGCPNTFKERHLHRFRHGVTTCLNASLIDIVTDYDQRSGVPESNFCQDYQGLSLRKRRKGGFVAQQMLVLRICESANLRICESSSIRPFADSPIRPFADSQIHSSVSTRS